MQYLLGFPAKSLKQALGEYKPRKYDGHPVTAEVYFAAAIAALDARDYDNAEVLLDEVIRLAPKNGLAYYERGRARCNAYSQKDKEALADLDKAISLGVGTSDVYEFKARIFDGAKQRDKAIEALTEAIKHGPKEQKYYKWRASLYFDVGEKKKARADYDKAISMDPNGAYLYLLRGQLLESMALYKQALGDYAKASEYDSGNDKLLKAGVALKSWAILLGKLGRNQEAIEVLNKSVNLDTTDDDVVKLRGDNYAALKKYPEAIKDYSKSIELGSSGSGSTFLARSRVYQAIGRDDLAEKDRQEAKKLNDAPAEKQMFELK